MSALNSIFRAVAGMGKASAFLSWSRASRRCEQLEFAQQLGCEEVQGYYHGRPIPETEVARLLSALAREPIETERNVVQPQPSVTRVANGMKGAAA